jgi:hypothetical protein
VRFFENKETIMEKQTELASDCPEFKLLEFNPRRRMRGAEAARVEVDGDWLWMSERDLKLNIETFGPHPELLKALEGYQ